MAVVRFRSARSKDAAGLIVAALTGRTLGADATSVVAMHRDRNGRVRGDTGVPLTIADVVEGAADLFDKFVADASLVLRIDQDATRARLGAFVATGAVHDG